MWQDRPVLSAFLIRWGALMLGSAIALGLAAQIWLEGRRLGLSKAASIVIE